MKKINLFCYYLLLISFLFSCEQDDDVTELSYPIKFSFTSETYTPPIYYEVNENGHLQVTPNDHFVSVQDAIQNIFTVDTLGLLIHDVELLDDSMALVNIEIEIDVIQSFSVPYNMEGDNIRIEAGGNSVFIFKNNDGAFNSLSIEQCGYYYSFFNDFFQRRDISSLTVEFCSFLPDQEEEIVDLAVTNNNLANFDTVAIQKVELLYMRE